MVNQTLFDLTGRAVVITGAGGLLGQEHALAVGRAGGIPVLLELSCDALSSVATRLTKEGINHYLLEVDLTSEDQIVCAAAEIEQRVGVVWGLVNNVASNPPMGVAAKGADRLEAFPLTQWDHDIRLGLTSAFLCSRVFGDQMAKAGGGSIVNIASDLALISPDQRMYATGIPNNTPIPVKPVSYPVVKSALLGLTRYLATYWSPTPVRCNALIPGSVGGTQSPVLTKELLARIPLARLAKPDEYQGALVFLLSTASAYMTGANLVMDGGRTVW
jgi:NAD(P)-dependent dehydrogenase (short-subunit alcohol dehydrogenase family)